MLNYGNALFSIFDLVVLIYPDSNMATRIYTSQNLPTYDREGSIKESVERFCEAQVDPTDQKRYLRFMDFRDMTERIESSSRRFIQGFFRMRWMSDTSRWYTVRVTQLPASSEKAYMLTIQIAQGSGIRWLDMIAREQAELLEPD
jgi:hypothetical protein